MAGTSAAVGVTRKEEQRKIDSWMMEELRHGMAERGVEEGQ
jgi:hypothetical protein